MRSFKSEKSAIKWLENTMLESDGDFVYFQLASESQREIERERGGYWAIEWDWWENEFVHHYFGTN